MDRTPTAGSWSWWTKAKRAASDTDDETWKWGGVCPTLNDFDNGSESRATVLAVLGDTTHALTSEGHDASEDGTGRGTPVIAFSVKDHGADAGEVSPTLRSMNHDESHANGGGQVGVLAVTNDSCPVVTEDYVGALKIGTGLDIPSAPSVLQEPMGFSHYSSDPGVGDISPTMRSGTNVSGHAAMQGSQVRRLTPTECERLQGFPDDWTAGQADSSRYRQMGNAVAVPVVDWIMRRLVEVDADG